MVNLNGILTSYSWRSSNSKYFDKI